MLKRTEVLDIDTGFMMVEGGKIDWACHANDAAATITDTVAMDDAVGKQEFYKEHPMKPLILVTGDHETGGLTIGFCRNDYDTFLTNIKPENSMQKFDLIVGSIQGEQDGFYTVMADITELFDFRRRTEPQKAP